MVEFCLMYLVFSKKILLPIKQEESISMVASTGLEPVWSHDRLILSQVRIPISTRGQKNALRI